MDAYGWEVCRSVASGPWGSVRAKHGAWENQGRILVLGHQSARDRSLLGMEPGPFPILLRPFNLRAEERAQALGQAGLGWDPGSVTPVLHDSALGSARPSLVGERTDGVFSLASSGARFDRVPFLLYCSQGLPTACRMKTEASSLAAPHPKACLAQAQLWAPPAHVTEAGHFLQPLCLSLLYLQL